jgi:fructokinase
LNKKSETYGYVTTTPKEEWRHFPILKTILDGIKNKKDSIKVVFDTDVNVVAAYEFIYGGYKDVKENLAYITVGTGIGIGLITGGKMLHGLIHPEGGHVRVPILEEDKDFKGVCSYHGTCLEGLCTNVAIAMRLGLDSVDDVPNIKDEDPVWDKVGYYLGTACANLTLTLSIEKLVIGGGVMKRSLLYDKVR